jgi:hypothetical protein
VMPTVVLEAKDARGDVSASVTLDDSPLTESLSGTAIEVDPGQHHFVFKVPGRAPITETVLIAEGEKTRRIQADFAAEGEGAPHAGALGAPLRIAGIVTGSVGLVGLGLGAVFGAMAYSAWGSVKSECFGGAPCDVGKATVDRGHAIDFATASDVAFILGGVLAAAGVVMFVVPPRARREQVARIAPLVSPNVLGVSLGGTFP